MKLTEYIKVLFEQKQYNYTKRNQNEMENSIMIHFFWQINSFFLVPIWYLSACIKHFYIVVKLQFCIQLLKNNCNIVKCFPYCYLVSQLFLNDHVVYFTDLYSITFPILLDTYMSFKNVLLKKNVVISSCIKNVLSLPFVFSG